MIGGNLAGGCHSIAASGFEDFSVRSHFAMMPFASSFGKCLLHHSLNYSQRMDMPHERLRKARALAGFETASDAATALGVRLPTYIQHENGTRGLKPSRAASYARRFRVSAEWLLYGKGQAPAGPSIPSEDDLAVMLESAQREIPASASIGDWPRLVAGVLRTQLELFLADRAGSGSSGQSTVPDKGARSPFPTRQGAAE